MTRFNFLETIRNPHNVSIRENFNQVVGVNLHGYFCHRSGRLHNFAICQ